MRKILMALAALGLADSLYLTWIKWMEDGVCNVSSGCEVVNTSQYSTIGGVPIALLGAGAYLLMLVVLFFEPRNKFIEFNGPLIVFGLSLAGVLYSAYLTYLELYVIHAICPFCVLSAVILTAMLIVSAVRLQRTFKEI